MNEQYIIHTLHFLDLSINYPIPENLESIFEIHILLTQCPDHAYGVSMHASH